MEDLASMITQFLGSEEGMSQLRAVTDALGLDSSAAGGDAQGAPAFSSPSAQGNGGTPLPDLGGLFAALGGLGGGGGNGGDSGGSNGGGSTGGTAPGLDLNTMLLLGRAVSAFGQDDRNTDLLRALKPHFSPERSKKIDDAIKILQLVRLLPLVKDLGILGKGG